MGGYTKGWKGKGEGGPLKVFRFQFLFFLPIFQFSDLLDLFRLSNLFSTLFFFFSSFSILDSCRMEGRGVGAVGVGCWLISFFAMEGETWRGFAQASKHKFFYPVSAPFGLSWFGLQGCWSARAGGDTKSMAFGIAWHMAWYDSIPAGGRRAKLYFMRTYGRGDLEHVFVFVACPSPFFFITFCKTKMRCQPKFTSSLPLYSELS